MRFHGALTTPCLTEAELEENKSTALYFFSEQTFERLLEAKEGGATAGCPSEWMADGNLYVVTFIGVSCAGLQWNRWLREAVAQAG